MIRYYTSKRVGAELDVEGSVESVTADALFLITCVYNSIMKDDKLAAKVFKETVMEAISDKNSEVWQKFGADGFEIGKRKK